MPDNTTVSSYVIPSGHTNKFAIIYAQESGTAWGVYFTGTPVVATPTSDNMAIPKGYADGRFAALAGLASQAFNVAAASGATNATRLDQFGGSGFGSYNGVSKQVGSMYMTFASNASPTKKVIVQMGYVAGNNLGNPVTVYFPIAFPNNVVTVSVTPDASQYATTYPAGLSNINPNLELNYMVINGGISSSNKKMPMFWIAIGY